MLFRTTKRGLNIKKIPHLLNNSIIEEISKKKDKKSCENGKKNWSELCKNVIKKMKKEVNVGIMSLFI